MRQLQRTWIAGGAGLIACGVIGMLRLSLLGSLGLTQFFDWTANLLYAAAVVVLAIGLSPQASIVARRPLGVVAMSLVAVWPLVSTVASWWLGLSEPDAQGTSWSILGYVAIVVPVGAGLIAAMQIARVGVVEHPWRLAPLWVLALQVLVWVVPQVVSTAVRAEEIQMYADLFVLLGTIAFLASTLGLGILALVLGARRWPASVEVFRS